MLPISRHYLYAVKFYLALYFGLYAMGVFALSNTPIPKDHFSKKSYAQTLNHVASNVMQWYGQIIKNNTIKNHRENYPNHIQNIEIINAKLITEAGQPTTSFALNTRLSYLKEKTLKTQQFNEIFEFNLNKSNKFTRINRISTQDINPDIPLSGFTQDYYFQRHFAYAWMVMLDNNSSKILSKQNTHNANYQLDIGVKRYTGGLSSALAQRNIWMGQGEHLLRNISSSITHDNKIQLVLDIDWKGTNPKGKPSIAKIEQTIKLEKVGIFYKILTIKEQHLLPDIAPWEKLLC